MSTTHTTAALVNRLHGFCQGLTGYTGDCSAHTYTTRFMGAEHHGVTLTVYLQPTQLKCGKRQNTPAVAKTLEAAIDLAFAELEIILAKYRPKQMKTLAPAPSTDHQGSQAA